MFGVYLFFCLYVIPIKVYKCGPIDMDTGSQDGNNESENTTNAKEYLQKYGYLRSRSTNSSEYSKVDETEAIRTFQRFAKLNESGELDIQTSYAMSLPRCGFMDILPNTDTSLPLTLKHQAKWNSSIVRWKITSYSTKLTVEIQRRVIMTSFEHWTNNSGLVVEEAGDGDVGIDIKFVAGQHGDGITNAFDGPGNTIAHAFLPPDGDVHFDDDEAWTVNTNNGTELQMVAIHELGHALGLIHSITRESIMAPFYRRYTPGFELHATDVLAIQNLYGPPKEQLYTDKNDSFNETLDINNTKENKTRTNHTMDICNARFDAICGGNDRHINIFVDKYVYKVYLYCSEGQNCVVEGYPKLIRNVHRKGPKHVHAAAYIPDVRKRTYLFKGRKLWRYTGRKLDTGYPIKLKKIDLPFKPSAAYVQKTPYADYQLYLFSSVYFWEMNLYTDTMASPLYYIDRYWNRMPRKPDAITQTKDGNIYVFKGKYVYFWEMNLYTDTMASPLYYIDRYWNRMPRNPDAITQTKDGNIYVFKGKYYRKYDHRRGVMSKKKEKAPAWIGRQCGFADKDKF